MAIPTGLIAQTARDELPATWDALEDKVTGGAELVARRVDAALTRFFGTPPTVTEQDDLDQRVVDYIGKVIALSIINPGIDYWSKQRISAGARSEALTYKDRAEDLHRLREALLIETREMCPIIEPLLNVVTNPVITSRSRTRVSQVGTALTPDPYEFGKKMDEAEIIPLPRRVIQ